MSELFPVPDHIETHLGQIDPSAGYMQLKRTEGPPLQILSFTDRPKSGAKTLCTLGLSRHEFCSQSGHVRQELLMAVWDQFACKELSATLAYIGDLSLDKHTAICVGDVLGPSGPILVGSKMEAILCLPPNPFPSAFSTCFLTEPPTNFMWLVPISFKEAMTVKNSGMEYLMSHWLREGTDLLDMNRKCAYPEVC